MDSHGHLISAGEGKLNGDLPKVHEKHLVHAEIGGEVRMDDEDFEEQRDEAEEYYKNRWITQLF